MIPYTSQAWYNLAKDLYELILAEIQKAEEDLQAAYPKLVIMYEFFRLIRGEAFNVIRPPGVAEFQQKIYQMEDEIASKLEELAQKLDFADSKTKFYLDQMKKSFDAEYFKKL